MKEEKKRKIEIVPSINVFDFSELKRKIALVESFVSWIHIDVSDGVFTKHTSWHEAQDLIGFKTKAKIEVHLMVKSPEKQIDEWLKTPAERFIFHQEATHSHDLLIKRIHQAQKEAGMAIKPDTPWLKFFRYFGKLELMQILAVEPGPSGQKFNDSVVDKISHIRRICRQCIIEVDGGVNLGNAHVLKKEGADVLVAGNAIFESTDIKKAVEELKNI